MKILYTLLGLVLPMFLFAQSWEPLGEGLDARIECIEVDPATGYIYVGGLFRNSGNTPIEHVAYWDGNQWNPLGAGLNDFVRDLEFYNGSLYAIGHFTASGGTPMGRIAKWNGTEWLPVGGAGLNDEGYVLHSLNGKLYAGGDFTKIGSLNCHYVVEWDGNGWNALPSIIDYSSNSTVRSIGSYNGNLVIGGGFYLDANYESRNIAILGNNTWLPLKTGINNQATSIKEVNGELYITGGFNMADTIPCRGFAKWNGTEWLAISSPIIGHVNCQLAVDDFIILGGDYNSFNDTIDDFNGVANYNLVTEEWKSVDNGVNKWVLEFLFHANTLYAVGQFQLAGGVSAKHIAKIDRGALGIESLSARDVLKIYPNPSTNVFEIKCDEHLNSISVYNPTGQLIHKRKLNGEPNIQIELTDYPNGIYFINAESKGTLFSAKLIKQ